SRPPAISRSSADPGGSSCISSSSDGTEPTTVNPTLTEFHRQPLLDDRSPDDSEPLDRSRPRISPHSSGLANCSGEKPSSHAGFPPNLVGRRSSGGICGCGTTRRWALKHPG